MPIHTDNPREVGADRIVNALAAAELYGGPAIVVDLNGTATIFDVVDDANRYIGGAIAPGVELSLEALARRGAQLRSVELALPRDVIGKNTVEALQSGIVYGFAGLVDGLVNRIIESLGADPDHVTVIATGVVPRGRRRPLHDHHDPRPVADPHGPAPDPRKEPRLSPRAPPESGFIRRYGPKQRLLRAGCR